MCQTFRQHREQNCYCEVCDVEMFVFVCIYIDKFVLSNDNRAIFQTLTQ